MSIAAEFLAPTTDTGVLTLVSPDRRYVHSRTLTGATTDRLVKLPLDSSGLPIIPRVFPAHSGDPVAAYLAVGNDDEPQWPALALLTRREKVAAVVASVLGTAAIVVAALGAWVVTR